MKLVTIQRNRLQAALAEATSFYRAVKSMVLAINRAAIAVEAQARRTNAMNNGDPHLFGPNGTFVPLGDINIAPSSPGPLFDAGYAAGLEAGQRRPLYDSEGRVAP